MKNDPLPWFLTVITSVVAIDRLTKIVALSYLKEHGPLALFSHLHLTFVTNTGVSFGMLKGFPWIPFMVSILVITLISWHYTRLPRTPLLQNAVALVMGGAIGNLWDRIVYGTVIDFIDATIPIIQYKWPVFNVADSAITIGGVLLAYWCFFIDGKKKSKR